MGKFCKNCGKLMKNPKLTHCSDECLFADKKKSKSKRDNDKGIERWENKTDPWK